MSTVEADEVARATITVGERGRLVLPAGLRHVARIEPGTRVLVSVYGDGSILLRPYRALAEAGHGFLARKAPREGSDVGELIAERRAEAARED